LLASLHGEVSEFARKATLLEGELMVARQAHDMLEANFQGLSDKVAHVNQRWEDVVR
jgi:hypothetical protein